MNKKQFVGIICATALVVGAGVVYTQATKVKLEPLSNHTIVAHALGQIGEHKLTNSLDAFKHNYDKGTRVFEIDLIRTSDGFLAGRHDWESYLYERLEQESFRTEGNEPLSLSKFMSMKINNDYSPVDLETLMSIMEKYKDIYIVLDTKDKDLELFSATYNLIAENIRKRNPELLDRLVPQIYTKDALHTLRQIHDFENILYTLYQDEYDSDENIARWATENNVTGIVMADYRYSENLITILNQNNIKSYVHTINDLEEVTNYLSNGVSGIYSDGISENDIPSVD